MKKSITEATKHINQKQLIERFKLPSNVIRHLKDKNILKWKKVGRQHFFDEESVKQFQQSFNIDDYLTVGECTEKLQKYDFYSSKLYKGFYFNCLKIYITVTKLIEGSSEIPNEYRLESVKFGVTEYISKKSFAKTLNWLRNYNHKVNPKQKKQFVLINKVKKHKRPSMGKMKNITIIKQTHPIENLKSNTLFQPLN